MASQANAFRAMLAAGVLTFGATSAIAEPIATYSPDDFLQYAPRTALDLVARVPGFSIKSDNDGSRGLGQATGNVLLNGQRVSGKSNTAEDALRRIPVANVRHVELLDGALLDIPGLSGQVANVATDGGDFSGAFTLRQRYRENLPPAYDGIELSVTGEIDALTWTAAVNNNPQRGANRGPEYVSNGAGELTAIRHEDLNFIADSVTLSAGLNWTPANGVIANFNAELSIWQPEEVEVSFTTPQDGSDRTFRRFDFDEDETFQEISADYEFGLGPGRLKLIGLDKREHSPQASSVALSIVADNRPLEASRYVSNTHEGESILRAEYGWSQNNGDDWQVSVEGAFNTLRRRDAFFKSENGDALNQQGDGGSTKVEEERYEAFITHNRGLTDAVGLQISLGVEQSEIRQPDSGNEARSFMRPKGEIALNWVVSDKLTINTSLEREVGQLDFFDFAASRNIADDNTSQGNPDIVPAQSWNAEIEFENKFGALGASTLRIYADLIEDIVDIVPIRVPDVSTDNPDDFKTFSGPGNLDSAYRYGIAWDSTLKLDVLGWKGAEITAEAEWRDTGLDDPLTGETRPISGVMDYRYYAEFRHDIPGTNWAWGTEIERYIRQKNYRLDQISHDWSSPPYAHLFVEHKDIFGMVGTIYVGNVLDQFDNYERFVYEPERTGELVRHEYRSRAFGPILVIRLKGSF